jgi:hypothetical protein
MRFAVPATFVLVLSCFPPPLDEEGRMCDESAGRGCASGYVCFDGLCREHPDAGPDNWLDNGGFERTVNDAGFFPQLWKAMPSNVGGEIASDTLDPYEGLRTVRVFSRDGGELAGVMQTLAGEIHDTRLGQVWCARAVVRSNVDGGLLAQLFVRERPDDGGINVGENTPDRIRALADWSVIEERYVAEGAELLDVRVQNFNRMKKGEALWVDDVRLKRSATMTCSW